MIGAVILSLFSLPNLRDQGAMKGYCLSMIFSENRFPLFRIML